MKIARLNDGPEIFFSIQGEGKNLGRPSIFVRSSLCNLHCIWCDTDYTWNWEGTSFHHVRDEQPGYRKFNKQSQIIELSCEQIAARIREFPCKNVVITGGEPLLHQADWVNLMSRLREFDEGYWYEVETNGTLVPTVSFDALIDQYNVSPKTSNSGMEMRLRENPESLSFFANSRKAVFKFVVSCPDDLSEITALIQRYGIAAEAVYLMPEGTSGQQLRERQQWLVEFCKTNGFNFTDRLHIHIWGAKRGV